MKITKSFTPASLSNWRNWLAKNHDREQEVWLVYFKPGAGKASIDYESSVEEALCFGWIDSIVKTLDKERVVQRFSPRKPRSTYSPANKERLRRLVKQRKVIKEVRETLGDLSKEKFAIPEDILDAIKANKEAWKNFKKFSDAYKRIRIGFIEGARKRPQEFQKRLRYFIHMTERNKQYGFGGIDRHF
jgi:uncharacterized protein YdeI (YjbR/CyaY-like superfamily)